MKLDELIEFLKNADEEDCKLFITERMKYLNENEKGSIITDNAYYWIEPVLNNIRLYRFAFSEGKTGVSMLSGLGNFEGDDCYIFDGSEDLSKMLIENIKELDVRNIGGLLNAITKVVFDYFGSRTPVGKQEDRFILAHESRMTNPIVSHYGEEFGRFSYFKGSKKGWCHERSIIIHQLCKILGIESQLVCSPIKITKDNKQMEDCHTFNMIRINGDTYVIDTAMMNFINGNYEPSVEILPAESFDTLKDESGSLFKRRVQNKNGTESIIEFGCKRICLYESSIHSDSSELK